MQYLQLERKDRDKDKMLRTRKKGTVNGKKTMQSEGTRA